jgi:hypothetical protein
MSFKLTQLKLSELDIKMRQVSEQSRKQRQFQELNEI